MSRFSLQVGAIAGWLTLAGVLVALVILPTVIAGQQVSGTSDVQRISAYYNHPEFGFLLSMVNAFIIVFTVTFGVVLRGALRANDRQGLLADIALVALAVTASLYLVQGALAATLVTIAGQAGEIGPWFRFYDILYHGVADVMEGFWIGAFALAMLARPGRFPAWLGWLGLGLGLLRWVKATGPFVALPEALTIVGGLVLIIWLGGVCVVLTRAAMAPQPEPAAAPTEA